MRDQSVLKMGRVAMALIGGALAASGAAHTAAWEPTKPVEFVVPAGTGGGADQMARLLQGVITKNNLMKQPMIVVNKSGGAGAEVSQLVRRGDTAQDHHHAFQPVHDTAGNWRTVQLEGYDADSMLALDGFVLWVNAETPYKRAKEYIAAVKAGNPTKIMGCTGSKQEDQIITVAIEKATGEVYVRALQRRRRRRGSS
jgi:tripartite-type tricarboxylate transporter receptor subunit TctC